MPLPSGDVLISQAGIAILIPVVSTLFWLAWKERGSALDECRTQRDRLLSSQEKVQEHVIAVLATIQRLLEEDRARR